MKSDLRERIEAARVLAGKAATQTDYTSAGEKAIRMLPEILGALDDSMTTPPKDTTERDELAKDAERYRWLRDWAFYHSPDVRGDVVKLFEGNHGDEFTRAVDAAIELDMALIHGGDPEPNDAYMAEKEGRNVR